MKITSYITTLALLLTPTYGAINWYLGGDGTDLITGWDNSGSTTGVANATASWTGGGTIQSVPVVPTVANQTNTVIDDAPSGTIGGITMNRDGTTFDIAFEFTPADTNLPATADFQVSAINGGTSQGQQGGQGFSFTDLQNVAGIRVISTFDEALAARTAGASSPRSWGFGLRNRITPVAYDVSMTLPDLITLTNNPITNDPLVAGTDYVLGTAPAGWFSAGSTAGVPSLMNSVEDPSIFNITGGAVPTLSASIPLYDTSIAAENNAFNDWFGIEGIDYNGDGDTYDANSGTNTSDEQLAQYSYLHTVDWLISEPNGNAFTSTASFNFSMDGQQYNGTIANALTALEQVPEPTSSTLIGLGGVLLLSRRRRGH